MDTFRGNGLRETAFILIISKKGPVMDKIFYIVLTFFMGASISIYMPMNSSIARYLGSAKGANMIFFFFAFIASAIIFFCLDEPKVLLNLSKTPKYLLLNGIVSALVVLGMTILIPKLGAGDFFVLLIAGQILMALVVSHLGILESPQETINLQKLFGTVLFVVGAYLAIS